MYTCGPEIDATDVTVQSPVMPSKNPILPVRFATDEEKEMFLAVWELAGAPNFNAWAITLLREAAEDVLRAKAPNRLAEFLESRRKKRT